MSIEPRNEPQTPVVPQDIPVQTCEAPARTGGGAGLQQLAGSQEGQRHLDDVSRLTEAVHRQAPQLRYARADAGALNAQRTKLPRSNGQKR